MRERFSISEVYTGVVPGNTVAKKLYEAIGFRETGLVEQINDDNALINDRKMRFCYNETVQYLFFATF